MKAPGDIQKHGIALAVAQRVIDGLEIIHIHDNHTPPGAVPCAPLGAAEECTLVVKPCETVVICLIAEFIRLGTADAYPCRQQNLQEFIHPIPPFLRNGSIAVRPGFAWRNRAGKQKKSAHEKCRFLKTV